MDNYLLSKMPQKTIREVVDADQKIAGQKFSNLFLTINTQKSDPALIPEFKEATQMVLDNIEDYIIFSNKRDDLDKIDNIDVSFRHEVGGKYSKIHVHALIKIAHRSHIKIDAQRIADDIRDRMEIDENFHVDKRWVAGSSDELNVMKYLQKNLRAR